MPKTYVRSGLTVVDIAKALEEALEILVPKSKDEDGMVRYKEPGVDDAVLAKQLNELLGTKLGRGHVANVRVGRFGQLPKLVSAASSEARNKINEELTKLAERIESIEGILLSAGSSDGVSHLEDLDKHIQNIERRLQTDNNAVLHKALGEVRATQGDLTAKYNHLNARVDQLASKFVEMGGDELSNLGANESPIQRMRRLSKEKETGFKISSRGKHER